MTTHSLRTTIVKAVFLTAEDLRVAASILYQSYRDDPLFKAIFQADKGGYEMRLRATIREELYRLWLAKQPMIGLFERERLLAVVCLCHIKQRQHLERFWRWRLRLLVTAGVSTTQQVLNKEDQLLAAIPQQNYHVIAFIGVHPDHQHLGLGQKLLSAVATTTQQVDESAGSAIYVTTDRHQRFFEDHGYQALSALSIANVSGRIMFKQQFDGKPR